MEECEQQLRRGSRDPPGTYIMGNIKFHRFYGPGGGVCGLVAERCYGPGIGPGDYSEVGPDGSGPARFPPIDLSKDLSEAFKKRLSSLLPDG